MKLTPTAISILLAMTLLSCREKKQEQQAQQDRATVDLHTVVVQEVVQATSYTYLKVKEADKDFCIAINKRQIEPGATISFAGALEMNNFHSKDLKRTFDKIYFVNRIMGDGSSTSRQSISSPHWMKPELEKRRFRLSRRRVALQSASCLPIGILMPTRPC